MPTSITDYGADTLASAIAGLGSMPASYWVALCTQAPDTGYDGVVLATIEPSGGSYARQQVLADSTHWALQDTGVVSTLLELAFPVASADWGIITHWALCTAATNGEVFGYGEFDVARRVVSGASFSIPAGGITVGVAGPENPVVL